MKFVSILIGLGRSAVRFFSDVLKQTAVTVFATAILGYFALHPLLESAPMSPNLNGDMKYRDAVHHVVAPDPNAGSWQ